MEKEKMFIINNNIWASEWNTEKNMPLKLEEITVKSGRKVWWKCNKGHEWQARVADRTNGNNCPYCSGKKVIIGVNDLVTLKPQVASEWNYEKNDEHRPEQYCAHSGKRVWWKCKKGHEWQATIDSRTRNKGNGCPYCAGQKVIKGKNDLLTVAPEIAKEWSHTKNGGLHPDEICINSSKRVWWKCNYGHEWYVSPNSRYTQRTGCPKCSSELKTSYPEQAIFYYMKMIYKKVYNRYKTENGMELDIFIEEINTGIEYDGIRYHSSVEAQKRAVKKDKFCVEKGIRLIRVKEIKDIPTQKDVDCIYREIGRRDNDLDEVIKSLLKILNHDENIDINVDRDSPQILAQYMNAKKLENVSDNIYEEWDYERNGNLKPEMIKKFSHKKVWWKCQKGHSWQATMQHRTDKKATGCPFCTNQRVLVGYNDLQTVYPELAMQWADELNPKSPKEYTSKSYHKVWWKCEKGHIWEAAINKRVYGRGCPICSGKKVLVGYNDLETKCPELVLEWDYKKNIDITPKDVTKGSNRIVWWKCRNGHSWQAMVNKRVARNTKCPYCKQCM